MWCESLVLGRIKSLFGRIFYCGTHKNINSIEEEEKSREATEFGIVKCGNTLILLHHEYGHNDAIIKMCVCVPSSIKIILRLLFESMICYLLLLICPKQLIFKFAVSFRLSFSKTIYCERRNSTFFHLLKATTHFIIFTMRTSAETRSTVEDGNGFLPL